tara:strand:+ start:188 stop:643 length:456 start_codon:yes stop_codon:yes gene_type:complete
MPDFSIEGVHAFWYEYDRRTLYRIIASMEGVEDWVSDSDPRIDNGLKELGAILEHSNHIRIDDEALLVKLLSNLNAGRALRLMQFLDTHHPDTASKLLGYAEEHSKNKSKNRYADLFLKRNLVFERLQLLGRVFAPERINLVMKALETTDE